LRVAGAVGGPVKEERLDGAVGEMGVEIVAEDAAVLFRLDCRTPGTEVVVRVVVEDEVTGERVVVVVVVVEGEKDFECLTFVIPRAEAKAWVSREGPDCLGMGPGPRAFLLLEAEPMGTVSVWSRVSLALASPWGM
jgi:Ni,Fe-hydrogenase III component G